MYEERVGSCPAGWFPDTFLLFSWRRTPTQIVLRYELAPRRPGDRTVLRVDQGYVQVDRVGPRYVVSTVKYLLFDDARIPSGGQTLGLTACQLGWLDYSINQFGGSTVAAIEDVANRDPDPHADQKYRPQGCNGKDRSPSHNGLNMGQNGYTITIERGRIRNELYNTRDRCGKAGVSIAWRR